MRCLEVPVDTHALYGWLEDALHRHTPDIWIGVGVAVNSPAIRLENIGINVRCFDVPDINGITMNAAAIINEGPVAHQSNLKTDQIVQSLRAAGIPAHLSFHAGTHLCNQMLYSVRQLSEQKLLPLLSGFVHVPQSTENVAMFSDQTGPCSSMAIPMMTQALGIAVDCAVRQFKKANKTQPS